MQDQEPEPSHEPVLYREAFMSLEEADRLLRGDFGKVIFETILSHTTFIAFGRDVHKPFYILEGSGSGCFVRTPERLLLLTCGHVYHSFLSAKAANPNTEATVGGVIIDLEERLIDCGLDGQPGDVDIATFHLEEWELFQMDKGSKRPSEYWPPLVPQEKNGVIIFGFPAKQMRQTPTGLGFGYFISILGTKRVTDRQIVLDLNFSDLDGAIVRGELPAPGYNTGGLSGGPLFTFAYKRNSNIMFWVLGGIISEGHFESDSLICEPADRIRANGSIRRSF